MNRTPVMTRARLSLAVAEASGVSRRDADRIVETVFDAMAKALRSGEEVEIRGFGSFRLRTRKAHMARNPRTSAPVKVPERSVPFFRPGRALRERVNTGESRTGDS